MEATIYLITNNVNGHRYVGQTIQPVGYRWKQHLRDSRTLKYPLYRAILKYGKDNFSITVLKTTDDLSQLDTLEEKYIKKYKSFTDWKLGGYNLTTGGGGRGAVSESTRKKLSKALSGKPKSAEHNRKVGLANKGKPNAKMDRTKYTFFNKKTNVTFVGTRKDFYEKYPIAQRRVSELVLGVRRHSYLGWIIKR
jgi:group I intron endonuclease